ncbi:MAG: DUF983 domain-containing protein [Flavobacteriales bacterium]|nr:DUF983 domain-containing protein [Flavobacteriales bacterium]
MKKGSKLYSILKFKCPHCHDGDFFKSNNPYQLSSMSETRNECSKCNRKLSLEPGFYYGAMYVSYGLGVAHIVSFLVAKWILEFEMSFWNFIILVGITLTLLTPLYYAISKIVWANMFMNFKEEENAKS